MRKPWQYGMIGGLIVIAILYGIELTSQGLADVYGPLDRGRVQPATYESGGGIETPRVRTELNAAPEQVVLDDAETQVQPLQPNRSSAGAAAPAQADRGAEQPVLPPNVVQSPEREPSINRIADGTAGLLQTATSGGIRFVVSLFETITD